MEPNLSEKATTNDPDAAHDQNAKNQEEQIKNEENIIIYSESDPVNNSKDCDPRIIQLQSLARVILAKKRVNTLKNLKFTHNVVTLQLQVKRWLKAHRKKKEEEEKKLREREERASEAMLLFSPQKTTKPQDKLKMARLKRAQLRMNQSTSSNVTSYLNGSMNSTGTMESSIHGDSNEEQHMNVFEENSEPDVADEKEEPLNEDINVHHALINSNEVDSLFNIEKAKPLAVSIGEMIPFLKKVDAQDLRNDLELHASRQLAKDTFIIKLTNPKDPLFKQIEKQFLEQMQVHNGLEVHIQCVNVISNKDMRRDFCKMAHFINSSMRKKKPHKEITKLESFYLNQLPEEKRTNFNSDVPDCYPALFTVPPKAMESIALNGMHNSKYSITPLIEPLFGQGIYCNVNSYQHPQENTDLTETEDHTSNEVMCIAYVLPGNILPVTKVDTAANKPSAEGYHSHFAVTTVKKPETSIFLRWKDFAAARELPDQHYPIEVETESFTNTHMVVFDKRQILPQYFIEYVIRKERKSNLDLDFLHRLNAKRPDAKSVIVIPVSKRLRETHAMGIPIVNKMEEALLMGEELLISEGKHKMTDVLLSKKQRIRGQSQAPEKVKLLLSGQLVLYESLDHITIIGGQVFLTGDCPILHYCIFKNTRIVSERNSRPILSKCKFINCSFDIRDESALTMQHCSILNSNIELHNQASFHLNSTNIKGGYVLVKDTSTFTAHQNCTLKSMEIEQRDSCSIYIEKCVLIEGFNLFQANVDAASWLEIKDSKCIKIYQILAACSQVLLKNTSFKGCETALKIVDLDNEGQFRQMKSPQKTKLEIQVERCIFNGCDTSITQESNQIQLNVNHCTFINATKYGFASKRSSKATIQENLFHNSIVRFEGKSSVFFKRNKVTCDKTAQEINACMIVNHLATPTLKLNKFAAPNTTGMLLLRHCQPRIEQNNFIGMDAGLIIQGSANPHVVSNVFGSCNIGVQVDMNEPLTFLSNRFEKCKNAAYSISCSPSGVEITNEEFKICTVAIRGNIKRMINCKSFKSAFEINLASKFTSEIDQCTFEAKSSILGRVIVVNSVFKSESNLTLYEGSLVDTCTIEYPARITYPESASDAHEFSLSKPVRICNSIFNYPSYLDDSSDYMGNEPVIYVAQPINIEFKSNRWSTKKSFPILVLDHQDIMCNISNSKILDTGNLSLKQGNQVSISKCQFSNIDVLQVSEGISYTKIDNCSFTLGTTAVFESNTHINSSQFDGAIIKLFNENVIFEKSNIFNQSTCLLYSGKIKSSTISNSDVFVSTRVGSNPIDIVIEAATLIENSTLRVESDSSILVNESTIRNVNMVANNQSHINLKSIDFDQSSMTISNDAEVTVESINKLQGCYENIAPFNLHGSATLHILNCSLSNINLDSPIFDLYNSSSLIMATCSFSNCSHLIQMKNQAKLTSTNISIDYETLAISQKCVTAIVAKDKSILSCNDLTVGSYLGCIFTIEDESELKLTSCNIRDTKQAVNLMSNTHSYMEKCKFSGLTTSLYFSKKGRATLQNCQFEKNKQAVCISDDASIQFENCTFSGTDNGILIDQRALAKLTLCQLTNVQETAVHCRGEAKLQSSKLSVDNAIVGILSGGSSIVTCVQSKFSNCSKAAVLTKERSTFYGVSFEDILYGKQYAFLACNQSKIFLNDPQYPKLANHPNEPVIESPVEVTNNVDEIELQQAGAPPKVSPTQILLKNFNLAGLACRDSATIKANNVHIDQTPVGVYVQDDGSIELDSCHFTNNDIGIDGWNASSSNSSISNCNFTNNRYGIKMQKAKMTMKQNNLKKNKVGIYVSDSSEVVISNNKALNNPQRNIYVVDRSSTVQMQKNKTTNLLFFGSPILDRIPYYFTLVSILNLLSLGMAAYAIFILVGMVPQIDLHKTIWGLSNSQTLYWYHWAAVGVNAGSISILTVQSLMLSLISCIQSKRGYPFVRYLHLSVVVVYLVIHGLFSAFYHYLTYNNSFDSIVDTLLTYGFPYIQGAVGIVCFMTMLFLLLVQALPVNLSRKYYQGTWLKEHAVQINLNPSLTLEPRSAEANLSSPNKKQSIVAGLFVIGFHLLWTVLNFALTVYGVFILVGCFSQLGGLHELIWGQTITFEWYHLVTFAIAGIYALFQTIGNIAFTCASIFRKLSVVSILNIFIQVVSLLLAAACLGFFHYITYNISLLSIYYYYGFMGGLVLVIVLYILFSWLFFTLKLVQKYEVDIPLSFKPVAHIEPEVAETTTRIQEVVVVEDPPTPPPQDYDINDQSLDQYGDDDHADENDSQNDIPKTPRKFTTPLDEADLQLDASGLPVEILHPDDIEDSGFVVHQAAQPNQSNIHLEVEGEEDGEEYDGEDDEEDVESNHDEEQSQQQAQDRPSTIQEGSSLHDDAAKPNMVSPIVNRNN